MDLTVVPLPERQARGAVRLIAGLVVVVLAALGLVMPTAAAHAHAGTVVAVATAADDAQHAGSVDATSEIGAVRDDRGRPAVHVARPSKAVVRSIGRLLATSWTMPARIVGGVPPGRAPPVIAARPSGALPTLA